MTKSVQVKKTIDAQAEQVFDAWLDPFLARRFLFATPDGEMVRADIDPRVGGKFNFTDRRPGVGDVEHVGEYLEIERPRRLVFTFAVPKYDPAVTKVIIEIEAFPFGCEVTLTHEGVLDDWANQTVQGWEMILEHLRVLVLG